MAFVVDGGRSCCRDIEIPGGVPLRAPGPSTLFRDVKRLQTREENSVRCTEFARAAKLRPHPKIPFFSIPNLAYRDPGKIEEVLISEGKGPNFARRSVLPSYLERLPTSCFCPCREATRGSNRHDYKPSH